MLTGEIRSRIDAVWSAFWSGGIAKPIEVIEQITYLLFIRGLDDVHTREENKANRLGKPIERRVFPKGRDDIGKDGASHTRRCAGRGSATPRRRRCSTSSRTTSSRSS